MKPVDIKKKIIHSIEAKEEISLQELEIDYQDFGEIVEEMQKEGYIKDAMVVHGGDAHKISGVVLEYAYATFKGNELLGGKM